MFRSIFKPKTGTSWYASDAPRQTDEQMANALLSQWGLPRTDHLAVLGQQRDLITLPHLLSINNLNPTTHERQIKLLREARIDMETAIKLLQDAGKDTSIPKKNLEKIQIKLASIRWHSDPVGGRTHKRRTHKRRTDKRRTHKRRTDKRRTHKRRTHKRRTDKRRTHKRRTKLKHISRIKKKLK